MANLARQLRQEQEQQQQTVKAPKRIFKHRKGLSPGEKILGIVFGVLVCIGSIQIISNQSAIYGINKDIQDIEVAIGTQQKSNSDLSIQVSELSQYDRIKEKAKALGLELNDQNVKVVQ
jgi:cell division protein FtsL